MHESNIIMSGCGGGMEVSEQIRGFLEDGAGGCEGCGVVCVLEVLFDVGL